VTRLEESVPDLPARYGPTWREAWLDDVRVRVRILAQAVAVRGGKLFADAARWSRAAFVARDARPDDLRACLECLRDVLTEELPADAAETAARVVQAGVDATALSDAQLGRPRDLDLPSHALALEYLGAVLDGRQSDAEKTVLSAVEGGLSVTNAYEQILQPAQRALGTLWHVGEISIADEHAGTAVTMHVMSQLRQRFPAVQPNGKRLVATAAPGDLHDLGVRMVSDYFHMDGWHDLCLGANVPATDVVATVRRQKADLLAVGTSSALHIRAVGELIDAVRADSAAAETKVLVGGPPFDAVADLWTEVGADGYASTAKDAVRVGRSLSFGR
jgi:methanogenic corrinoid protein MtbC1